MMRHVPGAVRDLLDVLASGREARQAPIANELDLVLCAAHDAQAVDDPALTGRMMPLVGSLTRLRGRWAQVIAHERRPRSVNQAVHGPEVSFALVGAEAEPKPRVKDFEHSVERHRLEQWCGVADVDQVARRPSSTTSA